MKYVKSCLVITMLLSVGYSECNESNWEAYYPDMQYCDLEGADLGFENLSGADLSFANLQGAVLAYAHLWAADLEGANLYGGELYMANLRHANLTDTDFTDANCAGTFFAGATLEGTIFDGANLLYSYFDETGDCTGANFTVSCDGYDDASYDAGAESGDVNLDGYNNILDVVTMVDNIMNP